MGFHEIRFPLALSEQSEGGPGIPTIVSETMSGREERVQRHASIRHRYDVSLNGRSHVDIGTMRRFYAARGGLANGFRFKDEHDYNTTVIGHNWEGESNTPDPEDQVIGTGDGSAVAFQLVKRYTDAAGSYVREIRKPVADTVRIAVDGVEVFSPADWSVDDTTGLVTFTSAPALADVVTWGGEFDVPVRFGEGAGEVLSASLDGPGIADMPSVPMIELLDQGDLAEDFPFRGSAARTTLAAAEQVSIHMAAAFWPVASTGANAIVLLPRVEFVPYGGPIFTVANDGANGLLVKEQRGDPTIVVTTLFTLASGAIATFWMGKDGSGDPKWFKVLA